MGFAQTQTSCELETIAKPWELLLKRFSLSTSTRLNSALARGSTCFVELLLLNCLFKNSTFDAFFVQIQDPLADSLQLKSTRFSRSAKGSNLSQKFGCPMKWELGWVVFFN